MVKKKLDAKQFSTIGKELFVGCPQELIIFMVGGVTYEESAAVEQLSKKFNMKIMLGGNYVHNSKTYYYNQIENNLIDFWRKSNS